MKCVCFVNNPAVRICSFFLAYNKIGHSLTKHLGCLRKLLLKITAEDGVNCHSCVLHQASIIPTESQKLKKINPKSIKKHLVDIFPIPNSHPSAETKWCCVIALISQQAAHNQLLFFIFTNEQLFFWPRKTDN